MWGERWLERPPGFFRRLYRKAHFMGPPGKGRKVYLTFDDGPIPEATPWVLDVLDHYGVKATFFMVGDNVRKHPGLKEEVERRGHRVGNHTMHHLQGLRTLTRHYLADVAEADRLVGSHLFRPPHGILRQRQLRSLGRSHRIVMYDLVTRDYSRRIDAARVVANVRKYTRPGSIIVFHDSLKSIQKLQTALPESIEWLQEQGYTFGLL